MEKDAGSHSIDIAMIKFYGATVLLNVIDRALPGTRYAGVFQRPADWSWSRAARAARIYDGPDEVHRRPWLGEF